MTNAQEDEKELEEVMTLIFITRIDACFADESVDKTKNVIF